MEKMIPGLLIHAKPEIEAAASDKGNIFQRMAQDWLAWEMHCSKLEAELEKATVQGNENYRMMLANVDACNKAIAERNEARHEVEVLKFGVSIVTASADEMEEEAKSRLMRAIRAEKELANLKRWIPVEERLPEENQYVLGFFPTLGKAVTCTYKNYFQHNPPSGRVMIFQLEGPDGYDEKASHWKPIGPDPA